MNRTAITMLALGSLPFSTPAWAEGLAEAPVIVPRAAFRLTPGAEPRELVAEFSAFAGSQANAVALVSGLHNGDTIHLSSPGFSAPPPAAAVFRPPTGTLSWGEVHRALTLARASLSARGIDHPTPGQIKAALTGGPIDLPSADGAAGNRKSVMLLSGILAQRHAGMDWQRIGSSMGLDRPWSMATPAAERTTPRQEDDE